MTQEEKTELLKIDICARLPYGVKYYDGIHQDIRGIEAYHSNDYSAWSGEEAPDNFLAICRILELYQDNPILRPIEDLSHEITHAGYNDGKPFVPIVELAKVAHAIDDVTEKEITKIDFYSSENWGTDYYVEFLVRTSNMNTLVYRFSYDNLYKRFSLRDETRGMPLGVGYQSELFDLLNRLMIDYRGLIDLGLAKSVQELDKNPYEG